MTNANTTTANAAAKAAYDRVMQANRSAVMADPKLGALAHRNAVAAAAKAAAAEPAAKAAAKGAAAEPAAKAAKAAKATKAKPAPKGADSKGRAPDYHKTGRGFVAGAEPPKGLRLTGKYMPVWPLLAGGVNAPLQCADPTAASGPTQAAIAQYVAEHPGCTVVQLCAALPHSNVHGVTSHMVNQGRLTAPLAK